MRTWVTRDRAIWCGGCATLIPKGTNLLAIQIGAEIVKYRCVTCAAQPPWTDGPAKADDAVAGDAA